MSEQTQENLISFVKQYVPFIKKIDVSWYRDRWSDVSAGYSCGTAEPAEGR